MIESNDKLFSIEYLGSPIRNPDLDSTGLGADRLSTDAAAGREPLGAATIVT